MSRRSTQDLVQLLKKHRVVNFKQMQDALGGASRATVFRFLQKISYRRSYNHNGRYYCLHEPEGYDRFGLRSHGDVHFSRDGGLKATVCRLVHESEAGYTQRELQERLRVRVQSFLLDAVKESQIARERVDGVFVYVQADSEMRRAQIGRRRQRDVPPPHQAGEAPAAFSDADAIQLLLALIRHPGSRPEQLARRLRKRSPPISLRQVRAVFARYGLGEKGGASTF